MARYSTTGTIQCFNNSITCWIEDGIKEYYRALLPKAWYVNSQRTKAHISIVRHFEEPDKTKWDSFDGKKLSIVYDTEIKTNGVYFWLDAFSYGITLIRRELKLPDYLGEFKNYHITIGNIKEQICQKLE